MKAVCRERFPGIRVNPVNLGNLACFRQFVTRRHRLNRLVIRTRSVDTTASENWFFKPQKEVIAMPSRSTVKSRVFAGAARLVLGVAAGAACIDVAEAKPRAERIAERRIIRLEAMEQRMKAAAQMPPRPVDVRRAIRSGAPVPGFGPNAAPPVAARPVPQPASPIVAAPQPPAAVAASQPRTVAPPQQAKPVPAPAAEAAQSVTPVTAVDDGTKSVLVQGEPKLAAPTPADEKIEPIELLPPPPAK
jgi:hypothetical protein